LVDLYLALRQLNKGSPVDVAGAAEITAWALHDKDPLALQCIEMFAGFLGSVAGDLALTLGARGGVYLGGGIVPRWLGWFETSHFRERFEAKGRFSAYLKDIPVWVINASESPALMGAARSLA
jgi:glucokinase